MVVARHEDELPLSEGLFLAFAEISLCEFKQREGRWPSIQEAPPFTTPRVGAGQQLSTEARKVIRGNGLRVPLIAASPISTGLPPQIPTRHSAPINSWLPYTRPTCAADGNPNCLCGGRPSPWRSVCCPGENDKKSPSASPDVGGSQGALFG